MSERYRSGLLTIVCKCIGKREKGKIKVDNMAVISLASACGRCVDSGELVASVGIGKHQKDRDRGQIA